MVWKSTGNSTDMSLEKALLLHHSSCILFEIFIRPFCSLKKSYIKTNLSEIIIHPVLLQKNLNIHVIARVQDNTILKPVEHL